MNTFGMTERIKAFIKRRPLLFRSVEAAIHVFSYGRFLALSLLCAPLWFFLFPPKSVAVYTCIFGGKDRLKDPLPFPWQKRSVDFICFTDDENMKSDRWEVRKVDLIDGDPALTTRYYKILAHEVLPPGYEYSIWEDATHTLRVDPRWLLFRFLRKNPLALFPHPWRSCIYEEAKRCLRDGLGGAGRVEAQMKRYKEEGYPENNGLASCGVILRRHNRERVRELMENWFREVKEASSRDQLSFNYVCWKSGCAYTTIKGQIFRNPYFAYEPHIK